MAEVGLLVGGSLAVVEQLAAFDLPTDSVGLDRSGGLAPSRPCFRVYRGLAEDSHYLAWSFDLRGATRELGAVADHLVELDETIDLGSVNFMPVGSCLLFGSEPDERLLALLELLVSTLLGLDRSS